MSIHYQTHPNPYVGPRAFQRGEILYGRDREVMELLDLLIAERIVLLYSPSGAGKTSLVQASLIPELEQEGFHVLPVMRVSLEPPSAGQAGDSSNRYVLSLLLSLEETLSPEQQMPLDELAGMTLADYLNQRSTTVDEGQAEVLIFDQFEEILTVDPTGRAAKEEFFAQVGEALRERHRWVLFAMREDYLAGLDPYLRPIPTRLTTTYRLELLGKEAALDAIEEPARQAGVDFDPTASGKLADDLRRVRVQRPDGTTEEQLGLHIEPVQLQVVCRRLWEKLPSGAKQIEEADMEAVGDVDTALSGYYAERVATIAGEAHVSERAIREWFDRHLITEQGIRGQVLQGPERSEGLENRAIWPLVDAHLVRAEKRRGATWFELAHDRLIEPVRGDNGVWREAHLSALQRQAALWESQGRPGGLLLRDDALEEADEWADAHEDELTDVEGDFLEECQEARAIAEREQRQARRIRWLAVGATIFGIIAIVLAGLAWNRTQEANRERENALVAAEAEAAAKSTAEQRGTAVAQQATVSAENLNQALDTQTLFLADLSQQQLAANNPRLALLLALEGLQYYPDIYHSENLVALQDAMNLPGIERLRLQHDGIVYDAAFSPDGTRILTASSDDSLRVWDVETGEPLLHMRHADVVYDVLWNAEGTQILSGSWDGTARIWDAQTGTELQQMRHTEVVYRLRWFDDGRILTMPSGAQDFMWDGHTGEMLFNIGIGHVEYSTTRIGPDNSKAIVTASVSPEIIVFDLRSGKRLFTAQQEENVRSPQWYPTGEFFLTASGSDVVIWDATTGQEQFRLAHKDRVAQAIWSHDGRLIAVVSDYDELVIWDHNTGEQIFPDIFSDQPQQKPVLPPVDGVFWSPDDRYLITYGDQGLQLHVWDMRQLDQPRALPLPPTGEYKAFDVVWSADGERALGWGLTRPLGLTAGFAAVWDLETGTMLYDLRHEGKVNGAAFNADETAILTWSDDGSARLWDLEDNLVLQVEQPLHMYDLIPNGAGTRGLALLQQWLETLLQDGYVAVIDMGTGETLFTLRHDLPVKAVQWSPDNSRILTWDSADQLCVWDADSGVNLLTLTDDRDLHHAAWSPDGRRILSITDYTMAKPDQVSIWDANTGERLYVFPHKEVVFGARWNADGSRVLSWSADAVAGLWDANTGDNLLTLQHDNEVRGALWSADESRILTWSSSTVYIWNAQTGEMLVSLEHSPAERFSIDTAEWNPEETQLATLVRSYLSGMDSELRVWDARDGALLWHVESPRSYHTLRWNADGSRIVAQRSGGADMWDAQNGTLLAELNHGGPEFFVHNAVWNSDDSLILTHERDVRIWDGETGELVSILRHDNTAKAVWLPDARSVRTISYDGSVRDWIVDIDRLLEMARGRTLVPMSNQEREQFFLAAHPSTPTPLPTVTGTPLPTLTPSPTIDPAKVSPTRPPAPAPTRTPEPYYDALLPGEPSQVVESLAQNGVLRAYQGALAERVEAETVDLTGEDNLVRWSYVEGEYSDFVMGARIVLGSEAAQDSCGYIFHLQDTDNFYSVQFNRVIPIGGGVNIRLHEQTSGEWQRSRSPSISLRAQSPVLTDTTELILAAEGNVFAVFINGLFAGEFRDSTLTSGSVALLAATGEGSDVAFCEFTDIWVWDLTQE